MTALPANAQVSPGAAAGSGRRLRVMVLGLRGIVDVEGGIETHSRKLYPLLVRMGCDVEIVQRAAYFRARRLRTWHGVRLSYIWSPTRTGLEPAVHTVLGTVYAAFRRPDILHLHAIGPGLLAPLARLLGLRVVVTHHAEDYRHEKWGALARTVLRTGEWLAMRFANERIAVSPIIANRVHSRFGVTADVIPNGAPRVVQTKSMRALEEFGLSSKRYVLCVARITATKRQQDLIAGFQAANLPGWKLVLVGDLDGSEKYVETVRQAAGDKPAIVLTGFQRGRPLRELYSHAALFVLPSSVEGHPIALLEAISYGLPVLASDIPENLALKLPSASYFPAGDTAALAGSIARSAEGTQIDWTRVRREIRQRYSWRTAAEMTRQVYGRVEAP